MQVEEKDRMTKTNDESATTDALDRVLAHAEPRTEARVFGAAQALQDEATAAYGAADGEQWDLDDRHALRRVGGLSTELEDVTEVEYRQLRLENVVLVGVYPQGAQEDAENSLREL